MILPARTSRTPARSTRRRPLALVTAATLAVTLAACTGAPGKSATPAEEASASSTGAEGAPEGFEDYYTQDLEWEACGSGFECATAEAPLSWDDVEAGPISLELKRTRATGDKVGSLLINPGGPGASGVSYVEHAAEAYGEPLKESFDIVGFDPRGVRSSTEVICFGDADKDAYLTEDVDTSTDDALEEARAGAKEWADACAENTGELLGEVDTQSAAKDMDMLRAALGDEKLNYLGASYGTDLGATYAGLFPDRAGRLVLDGGIDPTLTPVEMSKGQAVGFETGLRSYVEDCQAGPDCPLTGSADDGMEQVRRVLDQAYDRPFPTSGERVVTQTLAFYGIATPLYAEENWPVLTQALDEVINAGTADVLLYLADLYNERNADGTFGSNSTEAFSAVNCLDERSSSDVETMRKEAAEIEAAAPVLGSYFTYGGLSCADWPHPVKEREYDVAAPGAAPILVVGTTGDTATPYEWSQGLASTLDSGVLVTFEGEGHTAYTRSNDCISDAVESYLVQGTVPEEGLTC